MSNEREPTGGEGVSNDEPFGFDDRRTGASLDALFDVLADEQRRRIVVHLDKREDDIAAFSDLLDAASGETDDATGTNDPTATDGRERAVSRLHHSHLPKLADAGLVEFDARSETVRYRGGPVASDWVELVSAYDSGTA